MINFETVTINQKTKLEDIYVVEIGIDWNDKWKTLDKFPDNEIVIHEFTDIKEVDVYLKYAKEVSCDGLGMFRYKLSKVPIRYSKKYKKI